MAKRKHNSISILLIRPFLVSISMWLFFSCGISNSELIKTNAGSKCKLTGQVRNFKTDEPLLATYRLSQLSMTGSIRSDSIIYEGKTDNNGVFVLEYDDLDVYYVEFYIDGFYVNHFALKKKYIKCNSDTLIYLRPYLTEE